MIKQTNQNVHSFDLMEESKKCMEKECQQTEFRIGCLSCRLSNIRNMENYLNNKLDDLKLQIVDSKLHFKKPCFNCSASYHCSKFEDGNFNLQKIFEVKEECVTCQSNFTMDRSFYHNCNICNASFTNCKLLLNHRTKEHNSKKPYQCTVCHLSISKSNVMHHNKHKLPYICPYCNKRYAVEKNLKWHILSHTSGKQFSCKYCNKQYKSKQGLDLHIFVHIGGKQFKCDLCDKTFANGYLLNRHKLTHMKKSIQIEKLLQCKYCPKQYKAKYFLNIHLLEHTGDKQLKCDLCNKTFAKGHMLKRHKLTHIGNIFQCKYCHKQYKSKVGLDHHHLLVHSDGKTFKCNLCDEIFATQHLLDEHKVVIHTENEISFQCKYCHNQYKSKWALLNHPCEHTGGKKFKCDACDKTFAKRHMVNRHKYIHMENSFQCKYCPKKCRTKRNLDLHHFVHTGDKKFKCDLCNKTFAKGYILNRHKNIHMENFFQCKYCPKQYTSKQNLELHLIKHNGGK